MVNPKSNRLSDGVDHSLCQYQLLGINVRGKVNGKRRQDAKTWPEPT